MQTAFFLLIAAIAATMMLYTAKVYQDCDGVVVRNTFNMPVCIENR